MSFENIEQMVKWIDPLCWPTVTACSDHCFHTCCLSVRPFYPTFQNLSKQNKFLAKSMAVVLVWPLVRPRGSLMIPVFYFLFFGSPTKNSTDHSTFLRFLETWPKHEFRIDDVRTCSKINLLAWKMNILFGFNSFFLYIVKYASPPPPPKKKNRILK